MRHASSTSSVEYSCYCWQKRRTYSVGKLSILGTLTLLPNQGLQLTCELNDL